LFLDRARLVSFGYFLWWNEKGRTFDMRKNTRGSSNQIK